MAKGKEVVGQDEARNKTVGESVCKELEAKTREVSVKGKGPVSVILGYENEKVCEDILLELFHDVVEEGKEYHWQ